VKASSGQAVQGLGVMLRAASGCRGPGVITGLVCAALAVEHWVEA